MDGTTKRPINGNSGKKPKRTSRKATSVPKKSNPRHSQLGQSRFVQENLTDLARETRPIRERIRWGSMWNLCRSGGLGNPQNHSWEGFGVPETPFWQPLGLPSGASAPPGPTREPPSQKGKSCRRGVMKDCTAIFASFVLDTSGELRKELYTFS